MSIEISVVVETLGDPYGSAQDRIYSAPSHHQRGQVTRCPSMEGRLELIARQIYKAGGTLKQTQSPVLWGSPSYVRNSWEES